MSTTEAGTTEVSRAVSTTQQVQRRAASAGLELVQCRRSFDKVHALDGFSISIAPGELVALLGPSGCGKTTALRAVAGLEQLDEGKVLVGGENVTRLPAHRRNLGMVFQAYSLFPNMNALDNVAFGLEVRKVNAATAPGTCRGAARPRRADRTRRALPPRALGRPAATGRLGTRPLRRAAPAVARRAAVGPRRQGARPAPRRDPTHPARVRHHHAVRHPRPGGGTVDVGPGRGDAQGTPRAARHAGRGLLSARRPTSSRSSSGP